MLFIHLSAAITTLCYSYFFVCSGSLKIGETVYFRGVIEAYALMPTRWVKPIAITLPYVELGVGVALLIPATRNLAWLGVIILVSVYSIAVLVNLARGRRDIDCGCASWGKNNTGLSYWLLARNLLLLAIAGAIAFFCPVINLTLLAWALSLVGCFAVILTVHAAAEVISNYNLASRLKSP